LNYKPTVSLFLFLSRYNQLLRIEEELGASAVYTGEEFRSPGAK